MKLNLGCGNDMRVDYINIDLRPNPGLPADQYQQGDMVNLDWLCGDGTVDEILALGVVQCVPTTGVGLCVRNWMVKLKKEGTLKIAVPDIIGIANAYAKGQMALSDFIKLMYGQQEHEHDFFRCGIDRSNLRGLIEQHGATITVIRISDGMLYMEAIKL